MKKVYKYGTGMVIPENSVYLSTVVENMEPITGVKQRYVWHYFLVETEKQPEPKLEPMGETW